MNSDPNFTLGEKYAFATASLVLGILSFVNFLGMEKAIAAILFGWMALRTQPAPALERRRGWAKAGMALGIAAAVILPTLILLNFGRIREVIEAMPR